MKLKFFIALLIAFPLYSMQEAENLLSQFQDLKIFEQPLELKKRIDACAQQLGKGHGIIQEMRALYDAQEIVEVQAALKKAGIDTDYSTIGNINDHPQTDHILDNMALLQRAIYAKTPSPDLIRMLLKWGANPNQCESGAYHPLCLALSKKLTLSRIEVIKILIPLTDYHKLTIGNGDPLLASILLPRSILPCELKLSLIAHTPDDVIVQLFSETLFNNFIIKPNLLPGCDDHQVQQAVLARKKLIEYKKDVAALAYRRSAQEDCDSFGVN